MSGSDPSYPLFPIFSFLGFVLAIIPLPWHLQAWNSGTCIYMFWASFACLVQFVNSVVWHGNINNPAPIWCDICMCAPYSLYRFLLTSLHSYQVHDRSSRWYPCSIRVYQQAFVQYRSHAGRVGLSSRGLVVFTFHLLHFVDVSLFIRNVALS